MSHYAVIAPALYSHFAALQALAEALIARGHRVTFLHQAGADSLLHDPHIDFVAVDGQGSFVAPSAPVRSPRRASGLSIRRLIADMAATTDQLCRTLPPLLERLDIDAVIADQMEAAGGLVAEALQLPYVSVACALPINREPGLPLPVMPFRYAQDEKAQRLYRTSESIHDYLMRPLGRVIAGHAERFGLPPRRSLHECLSPRLQISQAGAELDFPRHARPARYHAVGALRRPQADNGTPEAGLPAAWLDADGRPRVFASLGTLQGHRYRLFDTLAGACRQLGARLLIAHCGGLNAKRAARLASREGCCVTDFVDQRTALAHAEAVITHGGLNTVLDAIAAGTPPLVLPIAFDQPGVAARVVYHGYGERASRRAGRQRLAATLERLLTMPTYRQRLAAAKPSFGGSQRAAELIETRLSSSTPEVARCASAGI
ncbi:glycosyltransferase [Salinicola avicenniae]|uniref:glycosyltransferase n=1 Tax=Salinicola avicenniae TaxID=2916836 RepID=UPI00207360BA|nr:MULTISPECIES: glycosyltransferase [unclassified Salinicola]